ncbi:hypothetical protein MMC13_002668 [Lambiella insularis]|nr:hypothetical protein [Lambiella insularis]
MYFGNSLVALASALALGSALSHEHLLRRNAYLEGYLSGLYAGEPAQPAVAAFEDVTPHAAYTTQAHFSGAHAQPEVAGIHEGYSHYANPYTGPTTSLHRREPMDKVKHAASEAYTKAKSAYTGKEKTHSTGSRKDIDKEWQKDRKGTPKHLKGVDPYKGT